MVLSYRIRHWNEINDRRRMQRTKVFLQLIWLSICKNKNPQIKEALLEISDFDKVTRNNYIYVN